jgi:hypothetical protein
MFFMFVLFFKYIMNIVLIACLTLISHLKLSVDKYPGRHSSRTSNVERKSTKGVKCENSLSL